MKHQTFDHTGQLLSEVEIPDPVGEPDNRKLRKAFKEANASDAVALFFKPILEAAETLHRDGKKARAKKLIQDYPYPDAATKAVRDAILAIL